mgnify:FL=1|jgi:cyanate permease
MRNPHETDGAYARRRPILSLLIATLGGVGLWSTPVVLPAIREAFAFDPAGASLPWTATMPGFAQGGIVPSYALVVRDHFPAGQAGARVSLVLMATIVGMAVGGWAAGALYDATGSYAPALLHGIAWNLVNLALVLVVLLARRPPGRRGVAA